MATLKLTSVATILGISASSITMANSVIIKSNSTMPVKYHLAYSTGKDIVYSNMHQNTVGKNNPLNINIAKQQYKDVGVVITAVKHNQKWHKLPRYVRNYDSRQPGCWTRAAKKKHNWIKLTMTAGSAGQNSTITCERNK